MAFVVGSFVQRRLAGYFERILWEMSWLGRFLYDGRFELASEFVQTTRHLVLSEQTRTMAMNREHHDASVQRTVATR